jgi:DNA end-binding protein Ku
MAEQLVTVLEDEFRPDDYEDEYRGRVLKYIEAKAKGRKPKLAVLPKVASEPKSLMDALTASLKSSSGKSKEKAVA